MGVFEIIIVLIEGLLTFFSPCIIPVLPLYLGLLSTSETDSTSFLKSGLFKNTIAFVLGISAAFFLLGISIYSLSSLIATYQSYVTLVGGFLIVIMGLFYLDFIKVPFLDQERRMHLKVTQMNVLTAYLLGFTFSFGWTPCIGPMLASVLMMSFGQSFGLIFVYTLGFVIPFMVVALFYRKLTTVLSWVKDHMNNIKMIGGIVLILSGAYMMVNSVTELNKESTPPAEQSQEGDTSVPAVDFELRDQYGVTHQLSDYLGKRVYLMFWTTWCTNCSAELPNLERLYQEYGKNQDDVVILTVASPNVGREGDEEAIKSYIEEHGYTLPVLMDEGGLIAAYYGVQAVPTSFVITRESNVLGYIPGQVGEAYIKEVIESLK